MKKAVEKTILIAGVGNIFHGDDAFGVEVAQELMKRDWPAAVQVGEFGIRSYDFAYELMNGYDTLVLVDATRQGGDPGTLYLIEPDLGALDELEGEIVNAHGMNPVRTLALVETLGGELGDMKLYLVGCEPARLEPEGGELGLSRAVQPAVRGAVEMIESLIDDLQNEDDPARPAEAEIQSYPEP
jgi:hydrogenase maturation protease